VAVDMVNSQWEELPFGFSTADGLGIWQEGLADGPAVVGRMNSQRVELHFGLEAACEVEIQQDELAGGLVAVCGMNGCWE